MYFFVIWYIDHRNFVNLFYRRWTCWSSIQSKKAVLSNTLSYTISSWISCSIVEVKCLFTVIYYIILDHLFLFYNLLSDRPKMWPSDMFFAVNLLIFYIVDERFVNLTYRKFDNLFDRRCPFCHFLFPEGTVWFTASATLYNHLRHLAYSRSLFFIIYLIIYI